MDEDVVPPDLREQLVGVGGRSEAWMHDRIPSLLLEVGSIEPEAVKPSCCERCPSWKTHTSAPNDALIESRFMTTAFSGRTTDPSWYRCSRRT